MAETKPRFYVTELRTLSDSDASQIKQLIKGAKKKGEPTPYISEFFTHFRNPHAATFVARNARGRIIGFALAEVGRRYGRSWDTLVHGKWRRQGIGEALFNAKILWLISKNQKVITAYAYPQGTKIVKNFVFSGKRFREVKPDWLAGKGKTKFVLDLRGIKPTKI